MVKSKVVVLGLRTAGMYAARAVTVTVILALGAVVLPTEYLIKVLKKKVGKPVVALDEKLQGRAKFLLECIKVQRAKDSLDSEITRLSKRCTYINQRQTEITSAMTKLSTEAVALGAEVMEVLEVRSIKQAERRQLDK